jgi:hypothetical protein
MNDAFGEETHTLTWNSSLIFPGRTLATLESISMQYYNLHCTCIHCIPRLQVVQTQINSPPFIDEVPKVVASVIDSWKTTCQHGAVVVSNLFFHRKSALTSSYSLVYWLQSGRSYWAPSRM